MNTIILKKILRNIICFLKKKIEVKQDKIKGSLGQVVSFDEKGNMCNKDVKSLNGAVVPATEIERLEKLISSNRILKEIFSQEIQITNEFNNYDGLLTLPENIANGFICAIPMEVWPLDNWDKAYPRLNIFDKTPFGNQIRWVVASPRPGRFRVTFQVLYFQ